MTGFLCGNKIYSSKSLNNRSIYIQFIIEFIFLGQLNDEQDDKTACAFSSPIFMKYDDIEIDIDCVLI